MANSWNITEFAAQVAIVVQVGVNNVQTKIREESRMTEVLGRKPVDRTQSETAWIQSVITKIGECTTEEQWAEQDDHFRCSGGGHTASKEAIAKGAGENIERVVFQAVNPPRVLNEKIGYIPEEDEGQVWADLKRIAGCHYSGAWSKSSSRKWLCPMAVHNLSSKEIARNFGQDHAGLHRLKILENADDKSWVNKMLQEMTGGKGHNLVQESGTGRFKCQAPNCCDVENERLIKASGANSLRLERLGIFPRRVLDEGWLRKTVEKVGGCGCGRKEWFYNYGGDGYTCSSGGHTVAVGRIAEEAKAGDDILRRLGLQ